MAKVPSSQKRLILLDTHAIVHRAYHALPEFMNSKGEPTGAIYGLATMLFKIITELEPDYIVACFDLPKKTFRHEAYDGYKAGRAKTDDALVAQLIRSREFFKALSIPIYECEGFEADDLLGTISTHIVINNEPIDVIIASGDMDTLQLVNDDRVRVYTLKKGINDTILYNEKKVVERFGFAPIHLTDYKGLRGDPSDNIIGIKGIGEKTATVLIQSFGTIEKMYQAIEKNPDSVRALGITERILKLLTEGKDEALFSKTLATIRLDAPIHFSTPEHTWRESVKKENVSEFFHQMEFKSLHARFASILNGGVTPTEEKEEDSDSPVEIISDEQRELFQKAQIALWLLDSEKTNPTIEEIFAYTKIKNLPDSLVFLEKKIDAEKLGYVYREIEIPLIPIIHSMQDIGIAVDTVYLASLSKEYHIELSRLEQEIWKLSGKEFNINSPKQLGEVLFDDLGLTGKGMKKSAGGARSTRESELEKLRDLHPVIVKILEYRELQKLLSTYIDTLPENVGADGRLHAKFIQTGTTTGRFSSNNPNLQNIPIKSERGKNIRRAFVAKKGYKLASFDYSQIELRVAALMSQDSYFIQAFRDGKDIHSAVAMKVFGVNENEVTHDMRRRAKVINFGILYGMGVNALRQNLGTDRKDAQIFYDNYFAQFPTIAEYLESIKQFAKKHGYTETLFGRRRYFPGIKSPIPFMRAMAERMATNAPIQGTATADIIKIGMKRAHDDLTKAGLGDSVRLVLQVHDELVYEIKDESLKEAQDIIEHAMKNAIPSEFLANLETVPLQVSSDFGNNWGEMKE